MRLIANGEFQVLVCSLKLNPPIQNRVENVNDQIQGDEEDAVDDDAAAGHIDVFIENTVHEEKADSRNFEDGFNDNASGQDVSRQRSRETDERKKCDLQGVLIGILVREEEPSGGRL